MGGMVSIALNVTGSQAILEAAADVSWWLTVTLLNDSVLGALGSSCAWLSFYPHVVWWRFHAMFSLTVLDQWLKVELIYHGHWFRSVCEQESDRE